MNALLQFELQSYFKKIRFHLLMVFIVSIGVFAGTKFSISVGSEIYKNAPYTLFYMIGFLSLLSILFTTLLASQILFKEEEAHFNLILYATPITKKVYLKNRFILVFGISFLFFTLLVLGYLIGQQIKWNTNDYIHFDILNYLIPVILLGGINTFFCSALICSISWLTQNKLMTYISGLFIYILYMVALLFSNSPFMAQSMPQSEEARKIAALIDPFGLSGFFMQTNTYSITQKNTEIIFPEGYFLINRVVVLLLSICFLGSTYHFFSFQIKSRKSLKKNPISTIKKNRHAPIKKVIPVFNWYTAFKMLLSSTRLHLKYIVKSIPFILICLGLLFSVGMEIYGAIEKGIRLPQKYATSGVVTNTIIDTFPILGLIIILFYGHEIIWRSKTNRFHLIENATPQNELVKLVSKWLSLSIISIGLSTLLLLLGILFQVTYHYTFIDWKAYFGIYLFANCPLLLSAGLICLIQHWIPNKYAGLTISSIFVLLTATAIGKSFLIHPLLRFQIPLKAVYSDMNGFGVYGYSYVWLLLFGFSFVGLLLYMATQMLRKQKKHLQVTIIVVLVFMIGVSGFLFSKDFQFKNAQEILKNQAFYEKQFRKFQNKPQPSITNVITNVALFPSQNRYRITGEYHIQNKTNKPITEILVNFSDDFNIKKAILQVHNTSYTVTNQYEIINLQKDLLPQEEAVFNFVLEYQWFPVNGHQSFNAIVTNGSFMRISRYYPQFGYQADREIEKKEQRANFQLGDATSIKKLETPKTKTDDFIYLKMTISTENDQTAISVGELTNQWKEKNRNYFVYETSNLIPFRFAISSARYSLTETLYKGKKIEVYYHPKHSENVEHLIKNVKNTLDYCEQNFSEYPFKTIRFAEISSFTKGFAATAYPNTIFMTENTLFHSNIKADKQQDVINELAGHELSHIWWGNNQINPDDREGYTMLTESFAMYTELMLAKKMYGQKRVLENVNLHTGIYLNERNFETEKPLYKVNHNQTHLNYSKGMVVLYQLSEQIGEAKTNEALKNFLNKYKYPNKNPITTDFLNELYAITEKKKHPKIDDLFKKITLYNFQAKNMVVKENKNTFELYFDLIAHKYYENGKGKKTNVLFNDGVEIAIEFSDGTSKIIESAFFKFNKSIKIILEKKPVYLYFDPNQKFIKLTNERFSIL
ncbi:M1 family aminopeptidase [Flavobacterium sp. NRK F7]|uniref:M1 family aminopeptidase n=1 Tax=Flavobacterium sp. NRK F7 TaxID=2954930 RepID=UPI002090BF75|nr:M1 family aminopeptidase [Flavobacterium sp. NRK F7]MCO6164347.1 aminopeptidase [Flavobacterium sp. NRK F7]